MNTPQYERMFKALANRRRLDILSYLMTVKEATVGEITRKIKLSFKATSKHLIILRNAGFIDREQRSLEMHYSMDKVQAKIATRIHSLFSNSRELENRK